MRVCIIVLIVLTTACNHTPRNTAQGQWIVGTEKQQLTLIEQQFRGFDKAMMETGYRFKELYWAGQDENWQYAAYQLKKMRLAITSGLTRRPKRAASAKHFLEIALPQVEHAIKQKSLLQFNQQFTSLTSHCNACHAMEKVPFFTVKIPTNRASVISR